MALLTKVDLEKIDKDLENNIKKIEELTKMNIISFFESIYNTKYKKEKIGIIPITSGNGIIDTFSESILYTLQIFNMDAFITNQTDVSGYYEAIKKNADIILMADDLTYLAFNLNNKKISHNQQATGRIYSEILIHSKIKKDHENEKEVLIIGVGNVGKHAIQIFLKNDYTIYIFDKNENEVKKIINQNIKIKKYNPKLEKKFIKIFEATPERDTIPEIALTSDTIVSTPGIPRAISKNLENKYNIKLIMEPLGLGTMSMIYSILK